MAALDPTEPPEADEDGNIPNVPRATLKIVRQRYPDLDEELDDEYLEKLMGGGSSDDDDDEDDDDEEESNGGPSDPAKSKKAKQAAALKKLIAAAQEEAESDDDEDEEMADAAAGKTNGVKKAKKGKEPATSSDDDDDESVDSEDLDMEDFVICTLDTERVCLQLTYPMRTALTYSVELPAASGHHRRPQREGLLRCYWHSHHSPDW